MIVKVVVMIAIALAAFSWALVQFKTLKFVGSNTNATRSISVSGEGRAFVTADIATVQVTISTEAGTGDLAISQDKNSSIANAVTDFVKSQGVAENDIKVTNYSIYPRYNYSQDGQKFLGYSIRQDIQIKMRDLKKVGAILNGVVGEGANEVNNLQFTVDNPDQPREQARQEAISKAKENAKILADQLGIKLVRITSYSEGGGGPIPGPMMYESKAYGMGGGGVSPEIPIGQNEIQSTVSLTYEIE